MSPPPKVSLAPCSHKHLKFRSQGAILSCVDCPRIYHILMPQIGSLYGGVPDVGYAHPGLSEIETRHTPMETPRDRPLPPKLAATKPTPPKQPAAPTAPLAKREDPVTQAGSRRRGTRRSPKKIR